MEPNYPVPAYPEWNGLGRLKFRIALSNGIALLHKFFEIERRIS
jgi:hypothetical protein